MSKYLDADKLKTKVGWVGGDEKLGKQFVDSVKKWLDMQPAEDVAPVIHAHWIKHDYAEEFCETIIPNYECSHCHQWFRDDRNYCGECGAKMDAESYSEETIEDCPLIKRAEAKGEGKPKIFMDTYKCEGYQKSEINDEPCEKCKECKYYAYADEEEQR